MLMFTVLKSGALKHSTYSPLMSRARSVKIACPLVAGTVSWPLSEPLSAGPVPGHT